MKLSVFSEGFPLKKALVAVLLAFLFLQEISLRAGPALHSFKRLVLSDQFFSEGACFADIDGDGSRDVVSGPYWYAGPGFRPCWISGATPSSFFLLPMISTVTD